MKEIITLKETNTAYIATVKGETAIVKKNAAIVVGGIAQHPRMAAIKLAAERAKIAEWILINATE